MRATQGDVGLPGRFEAQVGPASAESPWSYGGNGKGTYKQVTTYTEMAGPFQKDRTDFKIAAVVDRACKLLLGGAFAAMACYLLVASVLLHGDEQSLREPRSPPLPFDCTANATVWQKAWSADKQSWCCQRYSIGCTTTSAPFDCMAGFSNWQLAWSAGKRAWCCDHYARGCVVTTSAVPFDCEAGFAAWPLGWAPEKKSWCCEHERVACPGSGEAVPTAAPAASWTGEFHDCQVDFASWRTSWTLAKKAWCCQHESAGCPIAIVLAQNPAGPAASIAPVLAQASAAAAAKKMGVAIAVAGAGQAPSPPAPSPKPLPPMANIRAAEQRERFDCTAGTPSAWGEVKLAWCCFFKGEGCDLAPPPGAVVPATAGSLVAPLSPSASTMPFPLTASACLEGYEDWKVGWSDAKKAFCCDRMVQGCGTHKEDAENEQHATSALSAAPQPEGLGFEGVQAVHHDCVDGLARWETAWDKSKKDFCCHNFGKGCSPLEQAEG